MSLSKRMYQEVKQNISQYQFIKYMDSLKEMYDVEALSTYDDIADLMNFEFNTLLCGEDIKIFIEDDNIDIEDAKLIYKNIV